MKIGIDFQAAQGNTTGLGVYTRNLVDAFEMLNEGQFSLTRFYRQQEKDLNTIERLYWENVRLPRQVRSENVDLLHVPGFSVGIQKTVPVVLTVHDLIGSKFPNQKGVASKFYWGTWLPSSLKRADKILADSEYTKRDILELTHVSEDHIEVVYPSGHEGYEPRENSAIRRELFSSLGIKGSYFLFVGTIEPRKNLNRILKAFAEFIKTEKTARHFQLVVVGSKGFAGGEAYKELLANSELSEDNLIFPGYLPLSDLNELYAGALAFLFPSLYEGFGIPVLEAMASGTPVLTSTTSSLPEVAGDAALLVDPENTREIAQAMKRFAEDKQLREQLIEKGFQNIKRFSWTKAAKQVLQVYKAVLV